MGSNLGASSAVVLYCSMYLVKVLTKSWCFSSLGWYSVVFVGSVVEQQQQGATSLGATEGGTMCQMCWVRANIH